MIDDDDEILLVMIEEMEKLTEYVGGPMYYYSLISPFERLCMVEEKLVRDQAIRTLGTLLQMIPIFDASNNEVFYMTVFIVFTVFRCHARNVTVFAFGSRNDFCVFHRVLKGVFGV